MATRRIVWSTVPKEFPAGTAAGGWLVTVSGLLPVEVGPVAEEAVNFELEPGSYTVTVARLDLEGNVLASTSQEFVVEAPSTVQIDVAGEIRVLDPTAP